MTFGGLLRDFKEIGLFMLSLFATYPVLLILALNPIYGDISIQRNGECRLSRVRMMNSRRRGLKKWGLYKKHWQKRKD